MYSLMVANIIAKLTVMISRFPSSVFYFYSICIMLFYSFTLVLTFALIINKLICDLPMYRLLLKKYQKSIKEYDNLKEKYISIKQKINSEKILEPKTNLLLFPKNKTKKQVQFAFNEPKKMIPFSMSLHCKSLEKLIITKKSHLQKIKERINDSQVQPILTSIFFNNKAFFLCFDHFVVQLKIIYDAFACFLN